jgi:hypothetical protein
LTSSRTLDGSQLDEAKKEKTKPAQRAETALFDLMGMPPPYKHAKHAVFIFSDWSLHLFFSPIFMSDLYVFQFPSPVEMKIKVDLA